MQRKRFLVRAVYELKRVFFSLISPLHRKLENSTLCVFCKTPFSRLSTRKREIANIRGRARGNRSRAYYWPSAQVARASGSPLLLIGYTHCACAKNRDTR